MLAQTLAKQSTKNWSNFWFLDFSLFSLEHLVILPKFSTSIDIELLQDFSINHLHFSTKLLKIDSCKSFEIKKHKKAFFRYQKKQTLTWHAFWKMFTIQKQAFLYDWPQIVNFWHFSSKSQIYQQTKHDCKK